MPANTKQVQEAVDNYNNAIANIDSNLIELSLIEELQTYSDELAAVWTSDNGKNTIVGLNKVISKLKEDAEEVNKAINDIKAQKCTFTTRHEEYDEVVVYTS